MIECCIAITQLRKPYIVTVRHLVFIPLVWAATNPLVVKAQSLEPISYILRFPEPHSHYMEVEAIIPSTDQATIDLMMPVWTPGSYFVREFARNLENITARTPSGSELIIESTRKNRWVVKVSGSEPIILSYRVYSHEMSVRTNWVDSDFALVNGAPTFITSADLNIPF